MPQPTNSRNWSRRWVQPVAKRKNLKVRFWKKVAIPDDLGGCWEWTAGKDPGGYGRIQCPSAGSLLAHRASYELHYGPIPPGMVIMHSCDNPGCENPAHLSAGTQALNCKDRGEKGRGKYQNGSASPPSKTNRECGAGYTSGADHRNPQEGPRRGIRRHSPIDTSDRAA